MEILALSHTTNEHAAREGSVTFQGPTGSQPSNKARLFPLSSHGCQGLNSPSAQVVTNIALLTILLLE